MSEQKEVKEIKKELRYTSVQSNESSLVKTLKHAATT
jgi:hypothetical protein